MNRPIETPPESGTEKSSSHRATRPEDRVGWPQRFALGAGGIPSVTGTMAVQYLGQPVYNLLLGLNPILLGIAFMIPRLWDAFADPFMGMISDNYRSRLGRRRPFILAGAVLMAVTFVSIWFVPPGWGEWSKFFYLIGTTILFYSSYTIFSVPLTSLSYEMTPDYHERTRVMACWGFFVTVGNLALNWYWPAAQLAVFSDSLTGTRVVAAVIAVVIFLICGLVPGLYLRERFYKRASHQEKIPFLRAVRETISSRPMLMLAGMVIAINVCGTLASSLALYLVIYYVCHGNMVFGSFLNSLNGTGFQIVGFIFIPIISLLATRLGKRRAMFAILGLALAGSCLKWFIFTPSMPYLLLLDSVLNGPIWVAMGVILPSMMADLCDVDEYEYGQRREGLFGAVFSWLVKFGLSLTSLLSGVALVFCGFDQSLGMVQSEQTLFLMRVCFTGFSALGVALAIVFLCFYGISEKKAYEIRSLLEQRRGKL